MRLLSQRKIHYIAHEYPHGDTAVDGLTVAALTGISAEKLFKTLVCRGADRNIYVFCIPAAAELDLKKAARAVREKSMAMIHVAEITPLTGYVRGGCSPIGMKKLYPTVLHESARSHDTIAVSSGKIGAMVEIDPQDIIALTKATTADLITEE